MKRAEIIDMHRFCKQEHCFNWAEQHSSFCEDHQPGHWHRVKVLSFNDQVLTYGKRKVLGLAAVALMGGALVLHGLGVEPMWPMLLMGLAEGMIVAICVADWP